jgi:hypothetical protein
VIVVLSESTGLIFGSYILGTHWTGLWKKMGMHENTREKERELTVFIAISDIFYTVYSLLYWLSIGT